MEVVHDLLNYKGLKIVQNTSWFNFSLDSVVLSHFVNLDKTEKLLDLCTGNAPIPLFISTRKDINIMGVEIQKEIYDLAIKSIKLNNKEDKIKIINEDVKNLVNIIPNESIDTITCNPPFFKLHDKSRLNDNKIKSIARHEILINLDDIFKCAKTLLKNGGNMAIVHRSERLCDIITLMRENNIEPKRIQFVYPHKNTESNIVLIEGIKCGKPGVKILEPIIAHEEDGEYTEKIKEMFE